MKEALRAHLKADAGVTSIAAGRVDWGLRPQGKSLPAVALTRAGGADDVTHGGPSGLASPRVQIDCWARKPGDAERLARAVKAALYADMRLELSGTRFCGFIPIGERDLPDADADGPLHRVSLDFRVWHGDA